MITDPDECTGGPDGKPPAGAPSSFGAPGWDWCAGTGRANGSSDATAPGAPASGSTQAAGALTNAGCRCSTNFTFGGVEYTDGACINPGGADPAGSFCYVDLRTCPRAPFALYSAGGPWDYCQLSNVRTRAGCRCQNSWTLFPSDPAPVVGGVCANPDNAPEGPYCAVMEATCDRPPAGRLNFSGQAFDYCAPAAAAALAEPPLSPSSPPPVRTASGCNCLAAWTMQGGGAVLSGAANPDDDAAGPWCPVDAKTCARLPYARTARGGYFDYLFRGANTTRAGCNCLRKWLYPIDRPKFVLLGTCASLDGDPQPWCLVDPSSCTRGVPTGRLVAPTVNSTDGAPGTPAAEGPSGAASGGFDASMGGGPGGAQPLGPVFDYC